ncbi:MAG TPA: winged helix-turn-helix domain-containing protein [Patescibacteria group bacterium]|nr:winged helix-turn-helix domain-containing protein [Patescibacteria group bacterium]
MEPTNFEQLYPSNTRKEEIGKTISIIKTGRSAQVIGIPGVGKSNVLRLLAYNKSIRELHLGTEEDNFHFIYMDFSEVRTRELFDIIKFILISLSYSLGERELFSEQEAVNSFIKDALSFKDELILSQALKKSVDYLAKEKHLKLVFMFDRFEEYIPNIDDKFFLNLKILRNRVKFSFTAIFAVTRPIEDILETALFGEFYEFIVGNHVFLPIKDTPGLAFRFSYLEKITGKKGTPKDKEEIERITGGHGKIAKLAYEIILSGENDKDLAALLLSKKSVRGALFEIWNYLTPEEQNDVESGDNNSFLEQVYLLDKGKLTIPIFAEYIKALPKNPVKTGVTYDPATNEIKKGEEIITDKLTPSEFRLLKFLIQNEARICEKDEIIANTWKDTKTQEGVTDQALDQIVYRMRKKVEDDPNKHTHIQTVKGRGYKFNS